MDVNPKEKDYRIFNPLESGKSYECEMIDPYGCNKTYPSEDIVCIADTGLKLCRKCYEVFREFQVEIHKVPPEQFDEICFFGHADDRIIISRDKAWDEQIEQLKTAEKEECKPNGILEKFSRREEEIEIEIENRRYIAECDEFRARQRDYMRNYMVDYTKIDHVIQRTKQKRKMLKEQFKDAPIKDRASDICPRCGEKSYKFGHIINTFGKFQRRKCTKCKYAYTDTWDPLNNE